MVLTRLGYFMLAVGSCSSYITLLILIKLYAKYLLKFIELYILSEILVSISFGRGLDKDWGITYVLLSVKTILVFVLGFLNNSTS